MKRWAEAVSDFKKKYNFTEIERCCANCKYMYWTDDIGGECQHKELRSMSDNDYLSIAYMSVLRENVCGAWEGISK